MQSENQDERLSEENEQFEQPNLSEMSADDWREYLTEHPDRRVDIEMLDQTQTLKLDHEKEKVMLFVSRARAGGGVGWGDDKTQEVLDMIAHGPDPDDQIHVRSRDDITKTEVRADTE